MQKKLRLLGVLGVVLLIFALASVFGFIYYAKSSNQPVTVPVTASPKALDLTNLLQAGGFTLESPPFEEKGVIMASVSGTTVLFSATKDLKTQVKALQLTKGSLKMDKDKPKIIDLRFNKIVLRY